VRIESLDDTRVAAYRLIASPAALQDAGLFVAEGRLVVERLLRSPRFAIHSVLVTAPAGRALEPVLTAVTPAPPVFLIDQAQMNAVVGFNIHRGCLALASRPVRETLTAAHLETARRLVVLEGVNNPDNVGGIFRSAAAFGIDLVVLGPACSDPLYRKAIRTSMAATLQLPFVDAGAWPQALDLLGDYGFERIALTPARDAQPLDAVPRDLDRVALVAGAEGPGLSDAVLGKVNRRVRIPMRPAVDSLNVTVAASIALHHLAGPRACVPSSYW
jgi:tRNA G18 (ribose-2'-O)-methylase SpoU